MLFFCIIFILFSNSVISRRDTTDTILFYRNSIISLLYSGILSYLSLAICTETIGLHGELLNYSSTNEALQIIVILVTSIVLILTSLYPDNIKKGLVLALNVMIFVLLQSLVTYILDLHLLFFELLIQKISTMPDFVNNISSEDKIKLTKFILGILPNYLLTKLFLQNFWQKHRINLQQWVNFLQRGSISSLKPILWKLLIFLFIIILIRIMVRHCLLTHYFEYKQFASLWLSVVWLLPFIYYVQNLGITYIVKKKIDKSNFSFFNDNLAKSLNIYSILYITFIMYVIYYYCGDLYMSLLGFFPLLKDLIYPGLLYAKDFAIDLSKISDETLKNLNIPFSAKMHVSDHNAYYNLFTEQRGEVKEGEGIFGKTTHYFYKKLTVGKPIEGVPIFRATSLGNVAQDIEKKSSWILKVIDMYAVTARGFRMLTETLSVSTNSLYNFKCVSFLYLKTNSQDKFWVLGLEHGTNPGTKTGRYLKINCIRNPVAINNAKSNLERLFGVNLDTIDTDVVKELQVYVPEYLGTFYNRKAFAPYLSHHANALSKSVSVHLPVKNEWNFFFEHFVNLFIYDFEYTFEGPYIKKTLASNRLNSDFLVKLPEKCSSEYQTFFASWRGLAGYVDWGKEEVKYTIVPSNENRDLPVVYTSIIHEDYANTYIYVITKDLGLCYPRRSDKFSSKDFKKVGFETRAIPIDNDLGLYKLPVFTSRYSHNQSRHTEILLKNLKFSGHTRNFSGLNDNLEFMVKILKDVPLGEDRRNYWKRYTEQKVHMLVNTKILLVDSILSSIGREYSVEDYKYNNVKFWLTKNNQTNDWLLICSSNIYYIFDKIIWDWWDKDKDKVYIPSVIHNSLKTSLRKFFLAKGNALIQPMLSEQDKVKINVLFWDDLCVEFATMNILKDDFDHKIEKATKPWDMYSIMYREDNGSMKKIFNLLDNNDLTVIKNILQKWYYRWL